MRCLQREIWKTGSLVLILCCYFLFFYWKVGCCYEGTYIYRMRCATHNNFFRTVFLLKGKCLHSFDRKNGKITIHLDGPCRINDLLREKISIYKNNYINKIYLKNNIIALYYNNFKFKTKIFFLIDGKYKYRVVIDFYDLNKNKLRYIADKNQYNNFENKLQYHPFKTKQNSQNSIACSLNNKTNSTEHICPLLINLNKKIKLSGFIQDRAATQFNYNKFEDKRYINTKIRAKIKYDFSKPSIGFAFSKKNYVIISWEWNFLYFEGDRDFRDRDFGLYEGYVVLNKGPFRIRLGKQIIRWGKTDQISPVDNVNSQDLRLFILPSYEDRKIPNWIGDVEFFKNNFKIEMVTIPFMEPNEVYFFDRNFSIFKELKSSSSYFIEKYGLPIFLKDYIDNLQVHKENPSHSLENIQGGGRVCFTTDKFDIAFSYLNGFDPNPYIKDFPVKNIKVKEDFSGENLLKQLPYITITNENIIASYIRRNIYGIEFEGTMDEFGIRGEAAYFDKSGFLTESLVSVHKPMLWYVVGIDYNGENNTYVNIQLSHNHIYKYNKEILYFKKDNISLLGEISRDFIEGDWNIGFKYSYFLSDYSYYLNPYIICKKIQDLNIEIGTILFGGDKDTLLGQYDLQDEIYFKVKYYF